MVVEKILKQLTPERVEKEIKEIQEVELPSELQKWVREYENVGGRSVLFWKIIYAFNKELTPFKISKPYERLLLETKFLVSMLVVLVDDIADGRKNEEVLQYFLDIINTRRKKNTISKFNKKEIKYYDFSLKVWKNIRSRIKKCPFYDEYKDLFYYDIQQIFNAMKYAYLVNKHKYIINKTENWLYSPHTSQGMVNCMLDLMCYQNFNINELGSTREVYWNAQKMARISNCLSTWKKEVAEKDFTGSVIVYAIDSGLLSLDKLNSISENELLRIISSSNIKTKLLEEWEKCFKEIKNIQRKIKLVDLNEFINKLEKMLVIYLIMENYKSKI